MRTKLYIYSSNPLYRLLFKKTVCLFDVRRKSGFTLGVIAGDPSRENIETQEVDPSTTRPEDFTADQREAFNTGINQE